MNANSGALYPPQLNISSIGNIPTTTQTFSISFPCTGFTAAEVMVVIKINISVEQNNVTSLVIKRRKICTKLEEFAGSQVFIDSVPSQSNSTKIFYFAVGTALVMLTILALFVILFYVKNKKERRSVEHNNKPAGSYLSTMPRNAVNFTYNESFRNAPSYSLLDERFKDLQERIAELTVQRCEIKLLSSSYLS